MEQAQFSFGKREPVHRHTFVFLRREEECVIGYNERIDTRTEYDVFFCEGCLTYQRLKAQVSERTGYQDEMRVMWRRET